MGHQQSKPKMVMSRNMQGRTQALTAEPERMAPSLPRGQAAYSQPRSQRNPGRRKRERVQVRFSDLDIQTPPVFEIGLRDEKAQDKELQAAYGRASEDSLDAEQRSEAVEPVPSVWRCPDSRGKWERFHWPSERIKLPFGIYFAKQSVGNTTQIHGLAILKDAPDQPLGPNEYRIRTPFSSSPWVCSVAHVNAQIGDPDARFWAEFACQRCGDIKRGLLAPAPMPVEAGTSAGDSKSG